jgi:predicted nucleic acid-binding Zn ribbon protein
MSQRGERRRPESLGGLIPRVLSDLGLDPAALALRVLQVWDEAIGPELAPYCRLDGIRHGILYANVPDSSWMQRLQFEKPEMLERLTAALGEPPAKEIRLRIAAKR